MLEITHRQYTLHTGVAMYLAEVVSTRCSDRLVEQFLAADTFKQLAHFLHEFLSPTSH